MSFAGENTDWRVNYSTAPAGSGSHTDIKGFKMKVTEIVKAGEQAYTHHYMQTMVGEETAKHTLDVPKQLLTLAQEHADAEVVIFGDDTLGIEIGGKLWAAELPHHEMRPAKELPHEVWQYCNLSMGRSGDTYAR